MHRLLIVPALLSAAAAAWACGDKLMLVMGARLSQIRPARPALILAYPGHTDSAAIIRDLSLQPAIKKAGHRIHVVDNSAGLENALKAGSYDLVVADVANAEELGRHLLAAPSKPVLLPVSFRASRQEQSATQKKYHCLMKAPADPGNYLLAIDEAMDWKLRTTSRR